MMLETTSARTGGLARGLRTLLLVSALATAAPAIAAEPTAAPAAGAYQPKGGLVLQLGDFEVLALIDREGAYAPNLAQSKQTPAQWERARHLMTPDGKMRAPLGGYLIRSKANNRLVLVDLGLGPYSTPGLPAGDHNMLQELTALGYKPSDITDIVLTHLHLDHIGWASVDGKSTFPNAKYHLPQSEWDYWIAKPEGNSHSKAVLDITQAVMKPVAPQLQAFSGESETLFPGFKIRHAPGHTPGTVIVELDSGGRKALILGDTAHSAMSLQDKTWPGNFDLDEAQTLAAKNALIDEAVATHAQVSAAHISGMRFGQIVETKDRGLLFFFNEK